MKKDIIILVIFSAVILTANLWGGSLSSWDEALYAQVAREIHDSGNWVDLTWKGAPYIDKPPLYMWVTAVFYKLFGVNEFSARLYSCLSGIGIVIFTYLLGLRLTSRKIACLSAVMLMSTYHFLWFSRMGTTDIAFIFFMTASLYYFLRSEEKRVCLPVSFIFFALAFMTKGTGALLLPLILVPYVTVTGKWGLFVNRYTVLGIAAFFIIVLAWYAPAYLHYGGKFLRDQFFFHMVRRTSGALDAHQGNLLTYFNVLMAKGRPWGILGFIASPFFAYRTARSGDKAGWLLVLWIFVTFSLFSLVRTKLHWYVLPIYPALAVTAAWGAESVVRRYSVPLVFAVSLASVFYFGAKKEVFALDFNPGIKTFAKEVETESFSSGLPVYILDAGDPGFQFYFAYFSENVWTKEGRKKLPENIDAIVVLPSRKLDRLGGQAKTVFREYDIYSAVKIEARE